MSGALVQFVEKRKKALRIVGIVGSSGSVLLMVIVFALVFRNEMAFDEAKCPYRDSAVRDVVSGTRVQEQSRRCLPDLEERRWLVVREGDAPIELGRRRMSPRFFEGGYTWTPRIEPQTGKVVLEVRHRDAAPVDYREVIATGQEAPQPGGRAAAAREHYRGE